MNQSYHKEILHIALPSILSNITVPLLGLIDLTIAGHLGACFIYRCHSHRQYDIQYDLLDFCIPADGNQRDDFTSLRCRQ